MISKQIKSILIILFLLSLILIISLKTFSSGQQENVKFVYIVDLNLFPTPFISKREKHFVELKHGLLIYESQAIFQDIIKFINQKLDFDFVVFGGNNVSEIPSVITERSNNIWHLFLDMVSEIKSNVLFVVGENEIKVQSNDELVRSLKLQDVNSKNLWWSYKMKNYLFVGLDSLPFFYNDERLASEQLGWLNKILLENPNCITVIFSSKALIKPNGNLLTNVQIEKFIKIIKQHQQIKLIIFGGEYLNKITLFDGILLMFSSSPIAYPCSFKLVEISPTKIKINTLSIPLKGVIKKAEQYLVEAETAKSLFPESPKSILKYVMGNGSDLNFELNLRKR